MQVRFAAVVLAAATLASLPGQARDATLERAAPRAAPGIGRFADINDGDGEPLTARERQKKCAAQWRDFSAAEKAAQGPKWPQFYNRCIKRLKGSNG